jgi:hypothetical protein
MASKKENDYSQKVVADAAAAGHLLVDLEQFTLSRTLPLARLSPDAPALVPEPLPDTLLSEPDTPSRASASRTPPTFIAGPTFDASTLPEQQREQFHRNLRAVEQVLAGATQSSIAEKEGIPRSTLGRLVRRTRQLGQIACVPHGSYRGVTRLHPAFAECIRRLFLLPTRLSMTAIREHTEMQQVAARLSYASMTSSKLKSLVNKGCPFVLVFRMKHGRHAAAAAQKFAQANRPVNGIANAQTFIQPSFLND